MSSLSSAEFTSSQAISRLVASGSQTLAHLFEELSALILALPGVQAFEIDPREPLRRLAEGPFLWSVGPARKKAAGSVSAPIASADAKWGELRIRFDLTKFEVESPVRFARFVAQQLSLVLARADAERRNHALRKQIDSLAADLDTRKFVQRAAGILGRQRGLPEARATAMLHHHAIQTGRDLRQVAEAVITAYSRNFAIGQRRTA
jgi:hypothetical protein